MKHGFLKTWLTGIVILLTSLLTMLIVSAEEPTSGITAFSVNPYGNEQESTDTVHWYNIDGVYYLFLPSGTDLSEMKIYFESDNEILVDTVSLKNGENTDVFTETGITYTLTSGENQYSLVILKSENVPAMFVTTDNQPLSYIHQDKNNKDSGKVCIHTADGEMDVDNKTIKQIKGRGNATWSYPKKPYNIKFDKKTSVLGMAKAKKWTLLAGCYQDNSLMKNASIFNIAAGIGLSETSEYRHVDLYINGEYLGNYLICESVEIADNRIETTDLDDENEAANEEVDIENAALLGVRSGYVCGSKKWVDISNEPENVSGGYLLEVDYLYRYHQEISGFISNVGMPIVLKSPEYASEGEVNYISGLWNEAEEALYSDTGYNSKGRYYTEYFDIQSLVKVYIMQELSKNVDSGITSFYFYKYADNDKFYAGPLWDFDHALGTYTNIDGGQLTVWETDTWYANQLYRNSIDSSTGEFPTFFAQCYKMPDFRNAVADVWQNTVSSLLNESKQKELTSYIAEISTSAVLNHIRWKTYGTTIISNVNEKYQNDANALINFIFTRKNVLDKGFAANGAVVVYNKNGGTGSRLFDTHVYSIGETATAKECPFVKTEYTFTGWNTAADGTGTAIATNADFTITDNYQVLYAQWEEEPKPSFFEKLISFLRVIIEWFKNLLNL